MPLRGWIPESAAARMAALIAMNNEFESNRLVDRLLDPSSGTDTAVRCAGRATWPTARGRTRMSAACSIARHGLIRGNTDVQLRRASLAFDERKFAEAEKMLRPLAGGSPPNLAAQVALARVVGGPGRPGSGACDPGVPQLPGIPMIRNPRCASSRSNCAPISRPQPPKC